MMGKIGYCILFTQLKGLLLYFHSMHSFYIMLEVNKLLSEISNFDTGPPLPIAIHTVKF